MNKKISVETKKLNRKIKKQLINKDKFKLVCNHIDNKLYLTKTFSSKAMLDKYVTFLKTNRVDYVVTNAKVCRSNHYRQKYLSQYPPKKKYFRCNYCSRIIKKDNMVVDHIIPIHKIQVSKFYNFLAFKVFKLSSVNSTKNLVACCKKCNTKKSDKGGYWILKGFINKNIITRTIKRLIILLLIVFLILYLMFVFDIKLSDLQYYCVTILSYFDKLIDIYTK